MDKQKKINNIDLNNIKINYSNYSKDDITDKVDINFSPIKPLHYHKGEIDVIDFLILHFSNSNAYTPAEGFFIGNIIKYVCRFKDKNGAEDLEKAKEYLNKLLSVQESNK